MLDILSQDDAEALPRTGSSAEGLKTLKKFSVLIAGKKMPAPAFRMVLTAIGDFAYSEDGILICPLSALKP